MKCGNECMEERDRGEGYMGSLQKKKKQLRVCSGFWILDLDGGFRWWRYSDFSIDA